MGKFKIPTTPPTPNKTIRFPTDVVEEVENAIKGKDCTFSAFVIAAVRAALEEGKLEPTRYDSYLKLYEKASQIKLWELK